MIITIATILPVQMDSSGYFTVDLILLQTAGNKDRVTRNTEQTLTAYTDI